MSAPPADELRGAVQQAIADLAEVAQWLPGGTIGEAGLAAVILDRLAEEMAEAAAMVRALPAEPAPQAGHRSPLLPRSLPPCNRSPTSPAGSPRCCARSPGSPAPP